MRFFFRSPQQIALKKALNPTYAQNFGSLEGHFFCNSPTQILSLHQKKKRPKIFGRLRRPSKVSYIHRTFWIPNFHAREILKTPKSFPWNPENSKILPQWTCFPAIGLTIYHFSGGVFIVRTPLYAFLLRKYSVAHLLNTVYMLSFLSDSLISTKEITATVGKLLFFIARTAIFEGGRVTLLWYQAVFVN